MWGDGAARRSGRGCSRVPAAPLTRAPRAPCRQVPAGSLPRTMEVILRNDQVESVRPGDKAVFTGMLVVVPDVAAPHVRGVGERVGGMQEACRLDGTAWAAAACNGSVRGRAAAPDTPRPCPSLPMLQRARRAAAGAAGQRRQGGAQRGCDGAEERPRTHRRARADLPPRVHRQRHAGAPPLRGCGAGAACRPRSPPLPTRPRRADRSPCAVLPAPCARPQPLDQKSGMINIRTDDDQEPEDVLAQLSLEQRVRAGRRCWRRREACAASRRVHAALPPGTLPCRPGPTRLPHTHTRALNAPRSLSAHLCLIRTP